MRTQLLVCFVVASACSGPVDPMDGGTSATGGGSVATGGGGGGGGGGSVATGGGGSSATGGGGGSAATGGGGGSASTGCAGHSYKLCEDFESAAPGALPSGWTQLNGWDQGTVTTSSDSAHGGTKALKSVLAERRSAAHPEKFERTRATAGTHWGRIFYRVPMPAPNASNTSNYFHITFVGLRASGESRVVDTVQAPNGTIQYLYNLPDDSCCNGSAYNWRYDGNWHCAEWYVNNADDAYKFFLDGTEITSIGFTGRTNARLADFANIALGTIYYVPSNGTLTAFLDDLAIDDTRIGCQ